VWKIKGVKRSILLTIALSLTTYLSAKADQPVFGNAPDGGGTAYYASWYEYTSSGGAVAFTPTTNITVSSVTLWLTDYNGQNGMSLDAAICNNFEGGPGQAVENFSAPTPNNGSTSAFTFDSSSGPTTLDAGQEYWLLVYGMGTNPSMPVGAMWDEGQTPGGAAAYDGTQGFNEPSSETPAFTVNEVPEPSVDKLICIPLLFVFGRMLHARWKSNFVLARAKKTRWGGRCR
jgi:hypothetical protein